MLLQSHKDLNESTEKYWSSMRTSIVLGSVMVNMQVQQAIQKRKSVLVFIVREFDYKSKHVFPQISHLPGDGTVNFDLVT